MAEDKVLQSEEELGLKSESSSGMSESSVSEIQEKRDLDDGLSSVSLDIEKCQVVFKKESDVAGFKSTVTKEAKVEAADGKQDHPDQSSSDEGKDEDLSAGKIKESEIDSSTGDKVSGIQVKLDFGDELSSGADKSHATSSDNGVDFNASLSVADTSGGKDSANHEKANLEDELFSVGQQTSSTAAVGNLDFADNGLSDESEATPVEKKVDMKDAPLVDDKVKAIQEKLDLDDKLSSDHFTSKKESVDDDDDGSKPKVGKEDNMAADENLAAAADNSSLVITETQVEAAEGDEDFPFNNSSEAQVEAAEGNQDLPGNSSLEADKSEVTSSDNGVDLNASLSIAATSEGKDSANQEKVNLEDELLSGQSGFKKESDDDDGKSTVGQQASSTAAVASLDFADNSLSDKSEATSVEKKVDMKDAPLVATSEGKDSANQEKVNLEDELLSGQFGFKKESDDDDGKSTVGQQASSTAAIGSLDFADNGLSDESEATSFDKKVDMKDAPLVDQEKSQVLSCGISKDLEIGSSKGSSEDKVKAIQEKLDLDDKLSSDHFTSKNESDDDGSKPKVGKEDNMAADENVAAADNGSPDNTEAISGYETLNSNNASSAVIKETQVEAAEGNEDFSFNNSSENKTSDDKDVDLDNDPLVVRAKDCFQQGNKEYKQGDFHRALQLYTEGLQLNCKDDRLKARLYNNRAAAHFRLENFENSLDDATVAVQLEPTFTKALEKGAEACVQLKLYDEAKIWCHKGLAMDDNSERLRHLLNKCGSETIASGEIKPQQVKEVEIAKEVGDKAGEGATYGNLGNAYLGLGQFKTAIDYHKRHLEIAKEVGDRAGEGTSYGNLGNAYLGLGQFKTAMKYYERLLEITKEVGDRAREGKSYGGLGNAYLSLGQFKTAVEYFKRVLEIAKEVGDRAGEGKSYGSLGDAYLSLGQFKTAIEYHKQHVEIAKEVGDKNGIAQALCSLATNFERQECLQSALDYYVSSRKIFNNIRASFLLNHNWKISYRNVHKTAYNGVWRVLLLKGGHVKALLAAEEGRAQTLGDIVDLKYNFRQTLPRWNSRKCSDCLSLRNVSSDAVFLAITGPYIALWVIRNGEVVQSRKKHVNNFLYQRELEVYITSLNKAASLQVSARAAVEWEKSSTQVGRDEKATSDGSPRNATTNALRKLYDIIVAPIADLIDGNELVFVPEGPLCLVPYAALVDSNSRYLCESFRIRVIPSLTILKLISDCPTELHNKTGALLVGDPCYKQVLYQGNLLNQLPGARKEVKMIGGILGIAPLVGGEATKEEVLGQISSVALIHIAAHGKKETGEILLAPNTSRTTCQAEEEDYLLTMRDVLRAGLRAKLVVLSCCYSACGEVMAEGVVGIARAFLGAGARSVLVSLWAIDDDGTQEFMKHFYGALEEGKGTSEAVNQAMKCMRKSEMFSKGNYWAPFVLIGDDVKLELTEI